MRIVRRGASTCLYGWLRTRRFSFARWVAVFVVLLSSLSGLFASAQPATKNVLILYKWGSLPASWSIMESTVRSRVPGQVNFYTSSVENPRFYEKAYRESLADTLQRGYSGVKLDAIVASGYAVLQFVVQYRSRIFPGVPIVFTDVSVREAQESWPGVTGVLSNVGLKETIDLALRLQPDTKAFAVVTGQSAWDAYWLAAAHSELLPHQDRVKEIDLTGPADRRLLERATALPPHTVVLFQLRPDDTEHPAYDPIDLLTAIAQRVPTYSAWQGLALNRGGIGGAYRDLPKEAAMNGEQVARVLLGQRPENIPILRDTSLKYRVDSPALQHWHISESALPPGTEIVDRQPSVWERDRKYIIGAIVLICAQFLLIAGLLSQRARKHKAEAVLRESEERFRVMADNTPALVWMCDERGKVTYLNDRWMAFTGAKPGASGDTWIAYIHPDDVSGVLEKFSRALKEQRSFSMECRMRRNDGFYLWIFNVASPRVNGDGTFGGFIGSAIDTTDQKLAQQALEKVSGQLIEAQENERSRIARDLHDDICQRLALLSMELVQVNRGSKGLPTSTQENLEEIRRHCSEIAADVQSLSHQLHSSKLDYLGIVAAIRGFCKEFSKQHEVEIEFTEVNVPKHLPKDISLCLFRVTQEAVQNALKYSGTSRYSVELRGTLDEVRLEVRDSGIGFDTEEAKDNRGLGLVSMHERVHLVHGSLVVESATGIGTKIRAVVPLPAEQSSTGHIGDSEHEPARRVA